MNGYELSRKFVDYSFENPTKIKPNHYALYFFAIEHCNRLGWKKEFGLPTTMTMEAIGIRSYNTYSKTFNDLIKYGFFDCIEKSKNQYSANIIALSNFNKALDKALDKAFIKHGTKQSESIQQSIEQSIDSIDKPINNKPINKEQETINNSLMSEIKISDLEAFNSSLIIYFEIAEAFRKLFIKNLKDKDASTKNQEKANFKNYVTPIRLMFEGDGITKEQFTKVFKFLDSPEGEFWKANILSTKKLREKFNALIMKANEKPKQNKGFDLDVNKVYNSDLAKTIKFN